jgi:hypothetical protein
MAAAATIALLASLLASAPGAGALPVLAAKPVPTTSPELFSTGGGSTKPRVVHPDVTSTLAPGFVDVPVLTGMTQPTKVRVAAAGPDGAGLVMLVLTISSPTGMEQANSQQRAHPARRSRRRTAAGRSRSR